MRAKHIKYFLGIIFLSSVYLVRCSESKEAQAPESEAAIFMEGELAPAGAGKSKKVSGIQRLPLIELNLLKDRLLEYRINLIFETNDFETSRKMFYEIVKKYGFIRDYELKSDSINEFNSEIWIKSDQISPFLIESEKIGNLTSESIDTIDLTKDQFITKVHLERERIRSMRRRAAMGNKNARDYSQREQALSDSENRQDQTKINQWEIQDKVLWAKVNILIHSKHSQPSVGIPNFSGILHDLATIGLYIVYIALYVLPIGLLLFLIYIAGRQMLGKIKTQFFRGKKP